MSVEQSLKFTKMNAASNDFIIFDGRNNEINLTPNQVSKISQRYNIGCDQLIIIKNDDQENCFMQIFNQDGSESGACGNATRCVAALLFEENPQLQNLTIKTISQILNCQNLGNEIAVNMGIAKFDSTDIPLSQNINSQGFELEGHIFYALNIGNPHIVTFLENEISNKDFLTLGPKLENHQLFPQKTNVEFAKIINDDLIEVRVHERGAGETMACGSGACAVGILAMKNNFINKKQTTIKFKGGNIKITLNDDNSVTMTGNYQKIFSGEINENFLN